MTDTTTSNNRTTKPVLQHIDLNERRMKRQLYLLAELLHDIRNLDPTVEQLPGWQAAVESGALDGWV